MVAASHHIYEFFAPDLRPEYPRQRHIVFVIVNFFLAALMLKRTKFVLPLLLFISVHQLYGHGKNILQSSFDLHQALYTDWAVIIIVPFVLGLYSYDVLRKVNSID